jgi:beta-N-acetylhexosaminidase
MNTEQKVGQVLMVGIPLDADDAALNGWASTLRGEHIGNIFLAGRWTSGAAQLSPRVDTLVQASTVSNLKPWVAVDQEGGLVQSLKGPGFDSIPAAVTQGRWDPRTLQDSATTWGEQLSRAGFNMNFAPVSDTVPAGTAKQNPPIGAVGRQYGSDPADVSRSADAFADGMDHAGIAPVLKHFPGLGLVAQNTDTAPQVTDADTDASGIEVQGFRDQIAGGAPWVMMSSATYPRLDPNGPAVFSRKVVTGLLKKDLGFKGAVVSDDLCGAKSAGSLPLGQRAEHFFAAGGDLFLCSAATPERVAELSRSISQQARKDSDSARSLDRAATKVVETKFQR